MPRSAATILGVMLVAFSIGFNTARYPVVWDMVNPSRATEAAQPAAAPKSAEPEPTPSRPAEPNGADAARQPSGEQALTGGSSSSQPIKVQPVSEAADKIVAIHPPAADAGRGDDNTGSKNAMAAAAETQAGKPLVPVAPMSSTNTAGNMAVGGAGIRRLPPLVRTDASMVNGDSSQLTYGTVPVYPTTGIE